MPGSRAARKEKSPRSRSGPARAGRARRSPEETEARILEAAIAEFSANGYSGGRIDRISQKARTVDRMLYYYFGNKERLFQAALEHVYEQMVRAQKGLSVNTEDPVAGMRELVAHSWAHYLEHPELVRLLIIENLHAGRHVQRSTKIRKVSIPLLEAARQLVASGQEKGLFRKDAEPHDVLLTVIALGFFYVSNQHTVSQWTGLDLMDPARQAHWLGHITGVVLDYLRTGTRRGG